MANEPQWRRPWEHQSSKSQIATPTNQLVTGDAMPLFSSALLGPTAAGITPTESRRLPPLHASLDASPEPIQPSTSRRASTISDSFEITSPNLTWQHAASASNKRRRVRDGDQDQGQNHPTHAYSSTLSHDGRHVHAQSNHGACMLEVSLLCPSHFTNCRFCPF